MRGLFPPTDINNTNSKNNSTTEKTASYSTTNNRKNHPKRSTKPILPKRKSQTLNPDCLPNTNPQKLTIKQQRFISEYLVDFNATNAAIRAGYSKRTAPEIGSDNLKKHNIQTVIREKVSKITNKTDVSIQKVLQGLSRLAFSDIRDLYNPDGTLKNIHELDDDIAMAISGIDISTIESTEDQVTYTKKIKLHTKEKSLELLGKYFKLFVDMDNAPSDTVINITLTNGDLINQQQINLSNQNKNHIKDNGNNGGNGSNNKNDIYKETNSNEDI